MIKQCEKYDIFNDKWIEIPEITFHRQNSALAVHNQRYLYAFCGYDGFRNVDNFERLDFLNESAGWEMFELKSCEYSCKFINIQVNLFPFIRIHIDSQDFYVNSQIVMNFHNAF